MTAGTNTTSPATTEIAESVTRPHPTMTSAYYKIRQTPEDAEFHALNAVRFFALVNYCQDPRQERLIPHFNYYQEEVIYKLAKDAIMQAMQHELENPVYKDNPFVSHLLKQEHDND